MSEGIQRFDSAARQQAGGALSGVHGDSSAELEHLEEVYRRRAEQLATRSSARAGAVQTTTLLVFSLGAETYGLPLAALAEVLPTTICTPVPGAAAEIAGVINLRGELRSVIDLRRLLGLPGAHEQSGERIVMLRTSSAEVGLQIGPIETLQSVGKDELIAPGSGTEKQSSGFIQAFGPDHVIILDARALLSHQVFNTHTTPVPN